MGFTAVKAMAIAKLLAGDYAHEGRGDIDDKNLLATGVVSAKDVADVLKRSRGQDHTSSAHHQDASVEVHVIACSGWYVKFYFDPELMFISVHTAGQGSES